eukprot:608945-Amphidinium_carterae.2
MQRQFYKTSLTEQRKQSKKKLMWASWLQAGAVWRSMERKLVQHSCGRCCSCIHPSEWPRQATPGARPRCLLLVIESMWWLHVLEVSLARLSLLAGCHRRRSRRWSRGMMYAG